MATIKQSEKAIKIGGTKKLILKFTPDGEEKALGALVGAVMKYSKGKADGKVITALLQAKKTA